MRFSEFGGYKFRIRMETEINKGKKESFVRFYKKMRKRKGVP